MKEVRSDTESGDGGGACEMADWDGVEVEEEGTGLFTAGCA